jgi:hypothetical protein
MNVLKPWALLPQTRHGMAIASMARPLRKPTQSRHGRSPGGLSVHGLPSRCNQPACAMRALDQRRPARLVQAMPANTNLSQTAFVVNQGQARPSLVPFLASWSQRNNPAVRAPTRVRCLGSLLPDPTLSRSFAAQICGSWGARLCAALRLLAAGDDVPVSKPLHVPT